MQRPKNNDAQWRSRTVTGLYRPHAAPSDTSSEQQTHNLRCCLRELAPGELLRGAAFCGTVVRVLQDAVGDRTRARNLQAVGVITRVTAMVAMALVVQAKELCKL
jgi:hypothetical protein